MNRLEPRWVLPYDRSGAVVVTGVFDILHVGHVRFLRGVRDRGLPLVVGVEDDPRVRAWKGPTRPLHSAAERAEVLAALRFVDGVFIVTGPPELNLPDDYVTLLTPLRPGALAHTAGDPHAAGRAAAAHVLGAASWELDAVPGRSTTRIVESVTGLQL
ncbi:adenylyltransferase/cytidyltransferase family protein [Sinosporangium siamense]|uniref:adenylyltransferase/cytidyltransferase family protein n=1 Tax=Sinosporangium siamense TaxID=1367973 RepID=UPI001951B179|nr:adenylyltransferase/cytidyltransferase family protein [Sinosporangium siamense]